MSTTRAVRGSMLRKSPGRARRASSAIWPAISTPVGPAPMTANVSSRSICVRVVGQLGELERAEDAARAARARRRCSSGPARARRTGRCRSRTARSRPTTIRLSYAVTVSPSALCEVTVRAARSIEVTSPSSTRGVLLPPDHLARRRRDLALGQDPGRHLVEQRLEQVVRGAGDDGDLDVGPAQPLGPEQPAEAGPDDDDPVRAAASGRCARGLLDPRAHGDLLCSVQRPLTQSASPPGATDASTTASRVTPPGPPARAGRQRLWNSRASGLLQRGVSTLSPRRSRVRSHPSDLVRHRRVTRLRPGVDAGRSRARRQGRRDRPRPARHWTTWWPRTATRCSRSRWT